MKRVAFASVSLIMDFTSEEDAVNYKIANRGKGWWFGEIYQNNSGDGYCYSMEVRRPYKDYNSGF